MNNKPPEFLEFLRGLGWIVNPKTHPGFSGRLRPTKTEDSARPVGISAQIPPRPFPYYTDGMTELAFVVPTLRPSAGDSSASLRSVESSDSSQDVSMTSTMVPLPSQTTHLPSSHGHAHVGVGQQNPSSGSGGQDSPSARNASMYMNIDSFTSKESAGSGVSESSAIAEGYSTYPGLAHSKKHSRLEPPGAETPRRRFVVPQDCAAIVVWLEKFEDHSSFPTEVLSGLLHGGSLSGFGSHKVPQGTRKSLPIIFIHMMSSGLYQILTSNSGGRLVGREGGREGYKPSLSVSTNCDLFQVRWHGRAIGRWDGSQQENTQCPGTTDCRQHV